MSDQEDNFSTHRPLSAVDRDKMSPVWDMSQERAFVETLLNQRFNFYMVFFSLVIAGTLNARGQFHLQMITSIGAFVAVLLAMPIMRADKKLALIMNDLKTDPSHPVKIIDDLAGPAWSKRRIVGRWIPVLCSACLCIAALAAWSGVLTTAQAAPGPSCSSTATGTTTSAGSAA